MGHSVSREFGVTGVEGKRQEKGNVDEDPEEGPCTWCRKAKGESRVGKEELVHRVPLSRRRLEEKNNQEVTGACGKHRE